ncbi:MAG: hypothetical protein IJC81_05325 [Clostridia bacterium]|nr:hypothetical protein [Clostridia bacterium]
MIIRIERKKREFKQFSKRCLGAMIVLWFVGALFGFAVVALQVIRGDMTVSLADLLLYIGAPMTGGIVSYMIKSALEDKRKKVNENEESEI